MTSSLSRLKSIDLLRGLAVLGMLLADFPGSWDHVLPPFQHAHWNGLTQTDLVFPTFLFLMGLSLTLSLTRRLEAGMPRRSIIKHVLKRTLLLIFLGLATNIFYSYPAFQWSTFRIMGVLQRIAILYFLAAWLWLYTRPAIQLAVAAGIALGYTALMVWVHVPGFGPPDLSLYPDGTASNLTAWIDMKMLGSHVFAWSKPWDPEGLLSTLPALINVLAGLAAGRIILKKDKPAENIAWLLVLGVGLALLGALWQPLMPINKKIWSSSFALFTSGTAVLIFASLYWLIDIRQRRLSLPPLEALGRNAIGIFTVCYLVDGALYNISVTNNGQAMALRDMLHQIFYASWLPPLLASLAYTLVFIAVWTTVFILLNKKGWYFKV